MKIVALIQFAPCEALADETTPIAHILKKIPIPSEKSSYFKILNYSRLKWSSQVLHSKSNTFKKVLDKLFKNF